MRQLFLEGYRSQVGDDPSHNAIFPLTVTPLAMPHSPRVSEQRYIYCDKQEAVEDAVSASVMQLRLSGTSEMHG